jgi:hypothetical protein
VPAVVALLFFFSNVDTNFGRGNLDLFDCRESLDGCGEGGGVLNVDACVVNACSYFLRAIIVNTLSYNQCARHWPCYVINWITDLISR